MRARFAIRRGVPKALAALAGHGRLRRRKLARLLPWSRMTPDQRSLALGAILNGCATIQEAARA